MERWAKKWVMAGLIAAMVFAVTACSEKETEEDAGTVYVPEYLSVDLEDMGVQYVNGGCCDGTYIYVLAEVAQEVEKVDPYTGDTYTSYESGPAIFRLGLQGEEAVQLENYMPIGNGEGEQAFDRESYSYVESISVDREGALWVTENSEVYIYDVPETFDPETDYMWNYEMKEHRAERLRRKLDSTGKEVERVDTTLLQEKLGLTGENGYMGSTVVDPDGNYYVFVEINIDGTYRTKIVVLDEKLEKLFEVDTGQNWGELILLGDGSVAINVYEYNSLTGEGGQMLKVIDREKKTWGEAYPMPVNAGSVYPGNDKYLFYYDNGDSLYGYRGEKKAGEKILTWSGADINRSDIRFFTLLEDGRVAAMTTAWGENGMEAEVALLTETDRSLLEEKTVLTYATMYLGYDVRQRIINFNKSQSKYRIEIKDYSEFNTPDDYNAGLTKLNTEITAGQVPDILNVSGLPVRQYGSKGLLEDLWPYIENDEELGGREGVMAHVLETASQNGKLYQLFNSFTIRTVVGGADCVGDRMSWSLADLEVALNTMPEGCSIFNEGDTKESMLQNVMAMQIDSFVDWSTGECAFDSQGFIDLLAFCDRFPLTYDWNQRDPYEYEDEFTRIGEGRQLLIPATIYDFQYCQTQEFIFGGPISYVGYPREDGGVGSSFVIEDGLAMSTTCRDKEGAWAFMREVLLPQSEEGQEYFYFDGWGFPVNRQDFDALAKQYMTPQYQLDEYGEPLLDENGEPIEMSQSGIGWGNGEMMELYATTREQYDQIMALYESVDSIYSYDESVYAIVYSVAQRYFNGDLTSRQAADQIQSRVKIYVNENL